MFESLQKLKNLDLSENKLSSIVFDPFSKLVKLKILNLYSNHLNIITSSLFYGLENLRELNLGCNKLEMIHEKMFKDLCQLEYLNLGFNQISSIGKETFCGLGNLKKFYLQNNKISLLAEDLFDYMPRLEDIRLDRNQIKLNTNKHVLNKLEYLKMLSLNYNEIDIIDSELFNKSFKLEYLDLSSNSLSVIEQNLFSQLTELNWLDLSSNKINSFVPNTFKLKFLNLFNNKLTSLSIDFSKFGCLQKLDISCNKLVDLPFLNSSQSIDSIMLNGNKIKSETLNQIKFGQLKKLDKLALHNNKLCDSLDINNFAKLVNLTLWENSFSNQKQLDLENVLGSRLQKQKEFIEGQGFIKSIEYSAHIDVQYCQLDQFKWTEIPMFAVLTGKNGIGKTSVLKFVKDSLQYFYKQLNIYRDTTNKDFVKFKKDYHIKSNYDLIFDKPLPLFLQINQKIESTGLDLELLENVIEKDPQSASFRASKFNSLKESGQGYGKSFIKRDKLNIFLMNSIESILSFLKNDLLDIGDHLSQEQFKYTLIIKKSQDKFAFSQNSDMTAVDLENLSPGEHLILLVLLWQYVFAKYEVHGQTVLLLDEPDSHLHPSAVFELLKAIKKLSRLGVQVIMTSHNATTVSFVEKENLFLLYEDSSDKRLRIKSSSSSLEIRNHLTSHLLNIEVPTRTIFVEGVDAQFYRLINRFMDTNGNNTSNFHLNFTSLINTQTVSKMIELFQMNKSNKLNMRDDQHEFRFDDIFGIIDGDGNEDSVKKQFLHKLFRLKRYAKENYVLDPINLYFYLKDNLINCQIIEDIKEKIKRSSRDQNFNSYSLNQVWNIIYSNDEDIKENCSKMLNIIIKKVAECFKEQINTIIDKKHLIDNKLIEKNSFKNYMICLDNRINKSKLKLKFNEIKTDYEIIKGSHQCLSFDLRNVFQENEVLEEQKLYIERFLRVDPAKSIETLIQIKNLGAVHEEKIITINDQKLNSDQIKTKLMEPVHLLVNNLQIEYPKFFFLLNGHDYEESWRQIFFKNEKKLKLCKTIIVWAYATNTHLLIPDEILNIFSFFRTNVRIIEESTFETIVFNLNEYWFVKFDRFDSRECDHSYMYQRFVKFIKFHLL